MEKYLDDRSKFSDADLGLDARLLKAVSRMGFVYPTLVQAKAIPLALGGRDLLVRAATGSGKTAAYGLVVHQKVLQSKTGSAGRSLGKAAVRALVLVPTRELVDQTAAVLLRLAHYCTDVLSVAGLGSGSVAEQAGRLALEPDVVVCTPARAAQHVKAGILSLSSCVLLVLDEADAVLSFGHGEDVRLLSAALPRGCQGMLLSATLSAKLEELKRLVLHSPAILKLEDAPGIGSGSASGPSPGGLSQLYVRIPRADKPLLLYALLRLKLVAGKTLVFCSDVNSGYRLKLILDRFGIKSAVLNAELPANSRSATVSAFNKGLFDILVATDEGLDDVEIEEVVEKVGDAEDDDAMGDGAGASSGAQTIELDADVDAAAGKKRKRRRPQDEGASAKAAKAVPKRITRDAEYGVARGLDFTNVTTVINYDFPRTASSYVHRVGRTARGGAAGVALSLLAPDGVDKTTDSVLIELQAGQTPDPSSGSPLPCPLPFDVREVEPFRYRVEDVVRGVTDGAIKAARLEELKREVLASAALRGHFEDNPRDLAVLRPEAPLAGAGGDKRKGKKDKAAKVHLKHVPDYLLPPSLRAALEAAGSSVDAVLAAGKRKKKRPKTDRERAREASQAAMTAASARAVAESLAAGDTAAIPDIDAGAEDGERQTMVQRAAADVYSRHGGMGMGRSQGKADPLRTFTYQAHRSAAMGITLAGSALPASQEAVSGSGRASSLSAGLVTSSAGPRVERVLVAMPPPVDISAMVHRKLAKKLKG